MRCAPRNARPLRALAAEKNLLRMPDSGLVGQEPSVLRLFFREGFMPETDGDLRRCLRAIEKHGDRSAYVQARRLEKCL